MEAFLDHPVYFKCPKRSWVIGTLEKWDEGKKLGTCKASAESGGDTMEKLKQEDVHPMREGGEIEDVDDLLLLTELHDATLLHCVRKRYMRDVIYTNIGAIVVALNPFNFKIPRYLDTMMPQYLAEGEVIEKNLPHSWAQAHNTFFDMKNSKFNQTILVSGESGAGKTEASKIVMKYLAAISCLHGEGAQKDAAKEVGVKINLCSPPLEAFGNAKTVRNDNSSRFGKFMRVKFDQNCFLVGAHVTKYLLEKSRIIVAAQGERCYHSFYLLLRSKGKAKYFLEEDKKYRTVSSGNTLNNVEFDSDKEFEEVCTSLRSIGVKDGDIDAMWRSIAAILHFENVDFLPDGEGSIPAPSCGDLIDKGTKLWSINKADFIHELQETTLQIMGKPVKKLMSASQAADARSALDKAIYDQTFACRSMQRDAGRTRRQVQQLDRSTRYLWFRRLQSKQL